MNLSLVPYAESPALEKSGSRGYRECLRNHAAAMGGQAYDGCGEFMAGKEEALKCAACGCHRNFHRREDSASRGQLVLYDRKPTVPTPVPVAFCPPPLPFHQIPPPPPPPLLEVGRGGSETPPRREEGAPMMRKRCRTKFTAEQKEKMQEFADKLGWRIQKHDDEALEEFCIEVGVKRHVLKVWMHNHKNNRSAASVAGVSPGGAGDHSAAAPPTISV